MSLKVILDADVIADFYKDNRTGIFRVTYEFFKALSKSDSAETFYAHLSLLDHETTTEELEYFFKENSIKIEAANHRDKRRFLPFRKEKLFRKLYQQLGISYFENKHFEVFKEAQIFHSFYYPIPEDIRKYRNLKNVITVHDLIPVLFPDLHFTSNFIEKIIDSITEDDYVVCVSENTKKDLLKYAPHLNPDHVFVNLLAASESLFYVCNDEDKFKEMKAKYGLPDKYFLSVGTLEPRKNVDFVIKNFLQCIRENKIEDLSLVLVGAKGWDYDKIFELYDNSHELKDKLIITGRVPDEDLASLYSHAHSFYYMSLYEGFGLPPLEAMQCGVATVTSNISSLPEVLGEAGITLDPKDNAALQKVMLDLYQNEALRQEYSQKGLERSKLFSWKKSAENLIKIYEKILQS